MSSDSHILGLDIGGTKIAAVVGTAKGDIFWRKQIPTLVNRGFDVVFEDIVSLAGEARAADPRVSVVSISIGGPLDILQGIIKSPPNLPGWDEIPLKAKLSERLSLPCFVEHDGNAGALAEYFFGAGRGLQNMVFITMGTGFGGGFIINGKIYRGTTDTAGEIGHIRIAEDGPLCYGKRGSMEGYGSGTGIAKLAHLMYPKLWEENATMIEVYKSYQSGSVEARQVLEKAGFYLGRFFALVIDMLNPQRIIVGGIGMRLGEAILGPARKTLVEEALSIPARACEIVPSELGESIGDVASLCAALDQGGFLSQVENN